MLNSIENLEEKARKCGCDNFISNTTAFFLLSTLLNLFLVLPPLSLAVSLFNALSVMSGDK